MTEFTRCIKELPDDEFQRSYISNCYTCKFDDMLGSIARFSCDYNDTYNIDDINKKLVFDVSEGDMVYVARYPDAENMEEVDMIGVGVTKYSKELMNTMVLEVDTDLMDEQVSDYESAEKFIEGNEDRFGDILQEILEEINRGGYEFGHE